MCFICLILFSLFWFVLLLILVCWRWLGCFYCDFDWRLFGFAVFICVMLRVFGVIVVCVDSLFLVFFIISCV